MATDEQLVSDGSGSTASSTRASAPSLIFAILLLINALVLLIIGKRGFRLTTGCGLGLAGCLAGWGVLVGAMPSDSVYFDNPLSSDITVAASALGFYCLFFALGVGWFWPLGILALGWSAGMATALNILLLGNDLSIHSVWGQWVLIIFCGGLGFFAITIFSSALMPLASSLTGSFPYFLAIDLLVNEERGMSLGLRKVLDRNGSHRSELNNLTYDPSISTRTFIAASWAVAIVFTICQMLAYKNAFIPVARVPQDEHDRASSGRLTRPPPSHRQEQRPRSFSLPIYARFHRSIPGARESPDSQQQPIVQEPSPEESLEIVRRTDSMQSLASSSTSHTNTSFLSMLTQQMRSQWAGALSQYSSTDHGHSQRTSSILRPLKRQESAAARTQRLNASMQSTTV